MSWNGISSNTVNLKTKKQNHFLKTDLTGLVRVNSQGKYNLLLMSQNKLPHREVPNFLSSEKFYNCWKTADQLKQHIHTIGKSLHDIILIF